MLQRVAPEVAVRHVSRPDIDLILGFVVAVAVAEQLGKGWRELGVNQETQSAQEAGRMSWAAWRAACSRHALMSSMER